MNLAAELASMFDNHLTDDVGPVISGPDSDGTIKIQWESTNDGHPTVTFELFDTSNDDEDGSKVYDLDIHIGNSDNVGPKEMMSQSIRCMQQFYQLGLNTKFGHITGDF